MHEAIPGRVATVEFQKTVDEVLAEARALARTSPGLVEQSRRITRRSRIITIVIAAIFALVLVLISKRPASLPVHIIVFVTIFAFMSVFMLGADWLLKRIIMPRGSKGTPLNLRMIERLLREGKWPTYLGPLALEVYDGFLRIMTPSEDTRLKWASLQRIDLLPEHLALTLAPDRVIAIPVRVFPSAEALEVFRRAVLMSAQHVAGAAPPTSPGKAPVSPGAPPITPGPLG